MRTGDGRRPDRPTAADLMTGRRPGAPPSGETASGRPHGMALLAGTVAAVCGAGALIVVMAARSSASGGGVDPGATGPATPLGLLAVLSGITAVVLAASGLGAPGARRGGCGLERRRIAGDPGGGGGHPPRPGGAGRRRDDPSLTPRGRVLPPDDVC